ncbi:hypothetical protein [Streptomyces sviceus]|uniref:hypothetical protein n=1 Tax=Streptomyces sviceus TaxID=285530 RepID=UPI0036E9B3FA
MELELKHLGEDIRRLTAAVEKLTQALTASLTPTPTPNGIETRNGIPTPRASVGAQRRAGRLKVSENQD